MFKTLNNITLEILVVGPLSKAIFYALFVTTCFLLYWLSFYNITLSFVFFGIDDYFLLTSQGNNFLNYNSNSIYWGNYLNNHQGPQNNPNGGSSGIRG